MRIVVEIACVVTGQNYAEAAWAVVDEEASDEVVGMLVVVGETVDVLAFVEIVDAETSEVAFDAEN